MRKTLIVISSVVLSVTMATAEESAPAAALKLDTPPALDGRLDESCWRDAQPLTDFYVWGKDAAGRRVTDTEVRLAYDDAWLYLGIKCANPLQKLVLDPQTREHDGPVSADESVELFFSSDGTGKVYYHFMLSCFNIKAEQRIINGGRERQTWNQPWRSATAITADGWTAEAAIPLYLFLEYGDLQNVRLNITRNRRMPFRDQSNVITHEAMEHSTWQPVQKSFHELAAFARLTPLEPGKVQMPFLAILERVEVKPYFLDDGKNHYAVEIDARGANIQPGDAELAVTDQPVAGEPTVVRKRFRLSGTELTRITMEIPAPSPSARNVRVELRDAVRDEVLQFQVVENPPILKIMDAWLDRNYYTGEDKAVAVADIAMPADSLEGLRVAVELAGKVIESAPAEKETRVMFPVGDLTPGRYPARIILVQSDGQEFFAVETGLVKRTPKPGLEWKIDQISRVVLAPAGRPFFPIGILMAGVKPEDDSAFKDITDAGCNTFFQWHKDLPAEDTVKYLETAKRHGLHVVALLETGWQPPKDTELTVPQKFLNKTELAALLKVREGGSLGVRYFLMRTAASRHPAPVKTDIFREYVDKNLPLTAQAVQSVMNADNLLAYSSFDEPFDSRMFDMTQSLAAIYRLTHQTDGYHPVKVLYSSHIPEGSEYVTCCDILCTDPYWIPAGPAGRDTPNFVSKIVHWNDRRAEEFRKAVWVIPQAGYWSGCRKRGLTDAEQDCQNFLAIIHGARGLLWFSYQTMQGSSAIARLKPAIDKVKTIGNMAVQPAVAQTIKYLTATAPAQEYQETFFAPERESYPDIQAKIFRNPTDGGLVLVAANSRYYPVTATFAAAGLPGEVRRTFAEKVMAVKDGAFSEELEPFAVRAYRLDADLAEPVELTVSSLCPAKIPAPETAWPGDARMDRKNKFPNPGFEEVTVPGNPDYFYNCRSWTLDGSGTAKFGRNCVMLEKKKDEEPPWIWLTWPCDPQHDQPTDYTWSFWAKGAQGGEKIWARHTPSNASRTFTMTNEWRRYEIPNVVVPARHRGSQADFGILLKTAGQVWVDGLQLELGDKVTEFEE